MNVRIPRTFKLKKIIMKEILSEKVSWWMSWIQSLRRHESSESILISSLLCVELQKCDLDILIILVCLDSVAGCGCVSQSQCC